AGRSDLFYLVPDSDDQVIKRGDLVIVEADRGKDLGVVVNDDITPVQVQMFQQRQAEAAAVAEMGMVSKGPNCPGAGHPQQLQLQMKELHPKRLYRLAQPAEITMLIAKSQDESQALLLCQTKVREKNLAMEVVDSEYQWDRRKLTFYFVAERRIDFRELVRELFKIYKTRIWMCAVNPGQTACAGGIKN
ncbi:MAG: PSP1 C-terminal conserved region-domain-containing protein, partial [Olpidium bornovanus]